MTREQLINAVSKELERINHRIDVKIVKGISYSADARRHKTLLSHLARAARRERLKRAFGFLSFL